MDLVLHLISLSSFGGNQEYEMRYWVFCSIGASRVYMMPRIIIDP